MKQKEAETEIRSKVDRKRITSKNKPISFADGLAAYILIGPASYHVSSGFSSGFLYCFFYRGLCRTG